MNRRHAAIGSIVACVLSSQPAHADEDDPFDGATVAVQAGGALLGGVLLGGGVALVGAGIGQLINPRDWSAPFAGAVLGAAIGGSVGLVLGTDFAGDERGANGTRLGASLGLAGGVIVFAAFEVIAAKADWKVPSSVHLLSALITMVGGPIIGYHLTADRDGGAAMRIAGFVF